MRISTCVGLSFANTLPQAPAASIIGARSPGPQKRAKPEAKQILDLIEKELIKKPESTPALKGQFAGLRKYRVGDYRVIYALLGLDILILRIGNRKDVYKSEI